MRMPPSLPSRPRRATALAVSAFVVSALVSHSAAAQWDLRKQQEGIDVYTRDVAGSNFRAFRGEALIAADIDAIMAVLMNGAEYPSWFPDTERTISVSSEGNVHLTYSETSAPWPVSNRDTVYRYETSRNDGAGTAHIAIGVVPDAYPEQSGRVRIHQASGAWRLTRETNGHTRVVFEMHLEPGGGIPSWLANSFVVDMPFDALRGLREMVKEPGS